MGIALRLARQCQDNGLVKNTVQETAWICELALLNNKHLVLVIVGVTVILNSLRLIIMCFNDCRLLVKNAFENVVRKGETASYADFQKSISPDEPH